MIKKEPIIGEKFGRWTIIENLGSMRDGSGLRSAVLIRCECGNIRKHFYHVLRYGLSTSCGCFRKENAAKLISEREHKHNLSNHPLYRIWRGMKTRCYREKYHQYKDYGGRGVKVCEEWKDDFKAFYDWAIRKGWKKGLELDKDIIPAKLGIPALIYSPEMCSLVTHKDNMRSTRNNYMIEFNGIKKCIIDWAMDLNIHPTSLSKRIKKWPIEKALTEPNKNKK